MSRPVSAVAHGFEELKQVRIGVKVGSNLLGKLLVIHSLTQLQVEPNIVRNIFITEVYFHLKGILS